MAIGKTLRQLRKDKNLTLKSLSEKSGISISFISDIENERRDPSPDTAKKLADALNIDVTLLLKGEIVELIDTVKEDVNAITNPDIRAIARAGKNLTQDEAEELRKLAERLFPDAFKQNK